MSIKKLNTESTQLSDRVVDKNGHAFKLWLEFEETSPWNDLENDFANIIVDTLDGRCYGLNVWTLKFLDTAHKLDKEGAQNLNGLYLLPPDLFVKELTRVCLEKTMTDLLSKGNLEDVLSGTIFSLNFIPPYTDSIDLEAKTRQMLLNDLNLQLTQDQNLNNVSYELLGTKNDTDEAILELKDNTIVVVKTRSINDANANGVPSVRTFKDSKEFWRQEMKSQVERQNAADY